MYVVPLTGFEGVSVEVTTSRGKYSAWFLIHCRTKESQWWQVVVRMNRSETNITATLGLPYCLSCEVITDACNTHQ